MIETEIKKIKCCFCGKEVEGYGNDPRPIKVACEEMPRCCDECNKKFVVPTRVSVWGKENELRMALKLACEELMEDEKFENDLDRLYTMAQNTNYFETMARKKLKELRKQQANKTDSDDGLFGFAIKELEGLIESLHPNKEKVNECICN